MIKIDMKVRNAVGTGSSRALRVKGLIPAVLYGEGIKPVHLFIEERVLLNSIYKNGFSSRVFNIHFNSKEEKVIVRDIQQHPVSDRPIHVDFMRLEPNKSVVLSIPLNFINSNLSPGLKRGAVLNIVQHKLSLSCLPDRIPEEITIDLTGLNVGDSLRVNNISLPNGSSVIKKEAFNILATIVAPSSLKAKYQEDQEDVNVVNDTPESVKGIKDISK